MTVAATQQLLQMGDRILRSTQKLFQPLSHPWNAQHLQSLSVDPLTRFSEQVQPRALDPSYSKLDLSGQEIKSRDYDRTGWLTESLDRSARSRSPQTAVGSSVQEYLTQPTRKARSIGLDHRSNARLDSHVDFQQQSESQPSKRSSEPQTALHQEVQKTIQTMTALQLVSPRGGRSTMDAPLVEQLTSPSVSQTNPEIADSSNARSQPSQPGTDPRSASPPSQALESAAIVPPVTPNPTPSNAEAPTGIRMAQGRSGLAAVLRSQQITPSTSSFAVNSMAYSGIPDASFSSPSSTVLASDQIFSHQRPIRSLETAPAAAKAAPSNIAIENTAGHPSPLKPANFMGAPIEATIVTEIDPRLLSQPLTPEQIDGILDQLVDRLEFEFIRTYGNAGG